MLQKYELGTKVWCFKQQGKDLLKMNGVIQCAEIDGSGFVFYKIAILAGDEIKSIMANHASIAVSEVELDKKMALYHEFQEQQKALFEERIGKPEFTPNYIESKLKE
jgi:hypothetical protein